MTSLASRARDWVFLDEPLALFSATGRLTGAPRLQTLDSEAVVLACSGWWAERSATVSARLSSGVEALALEVDGRPVHVAWIATAALPIDAGASLPLLTDDVGVFDMYTAPADRGHGFQARFLLALLERIAQVSPQARVFATVHEGNIPSVRSFLAAGFKRVGVVTRRRRLGRSSCRPDASALAAIAGRGVPTPAGSR